jgi:long-chain acyl-CoA synthetase
MPNSIRIKRRLFLPVFASATGSTRHEPTNLPVIYPDKESKRRPGSPFDRDQCFVRPQLDGLGQVRSRRGSPEPLYWKPEMIRWAIDDLEADFLLVEDQFYPLIQTEAETGKIRHTIVCEQHKVSPGLLRTLQKYPDTPPEIEVKLEDPCTIVFTSGTTGTPKGVISSHHAHFASGISCTSLVLDRYSRHLVATPSFHISAIAPVCFQSFLGLTLVFPPELTAESLVQTIGKEKVNTAFLPPDALGILRSLIRQSDSAFSSLKRILSGGAKVPENVIKSGESPDFEVVQVYGATELNGIISLWKPEMGLDKIHTVGKTYLFPEVKILDPETKKAFHQGWFLTGDAGRIDKDGFLEIVDRYKDVIYSPEIGGIFPAEVEQVIRELPDVEDVSVTEVLHPQWSEIPCAFVKPAQGASLTKTEILQYVYQKLGPHKLKDVLFCRQPLPRNANGKVDKSQLRRMYQQQAGSPDN